MRVSAWGKGAAGAQGRHRRPPPAAADPNLTPSPSSMQVSACFTAARTLSAAARPARSAQRTSRSLSVMASGLQKTIITEGTGPTPKQGDKVCGGWLCDGLGLAGSCLGEALEDSPAAKSAPPDGRSAGEPCRPPPPLREVRRRSSDGDRPLIPPPPARPPSLAVLCALHRHLPRGVRKPQQQQGGLAVARLRRKGLESVRCMHAGRA